MKRWVILSVLMCLASSVYSQQYRISSVTGSAERLRDGVWTRLVLRETLSGNDMVRIGRNSALAIIDSDKSTLYSLGAAAEAPLSNIIKNQRSSSTGRFVRNIWNALTRGDTEKIGFEADVTYKDLAVDTRIYAALHDRSYAPSYALSMVLVDASGNEITGEATIGERFIFRITNNSPSPLFVNILDAASDGSYFDCLPIDVGGTMLHLLIPAQSTVDLKDYPMAFAEPRGVDTLTLVGSTEPFDLRNIVKLFENSAPADATPLAVGKFSLQVNVK